MRVTVTLVDVKMLLGTILITGPTHSWAEQYQSLPPGQSGPIMKKQVLMGSSVVTCPSVEEKRDRVITHLGLPRRLTTVIALVL